MSAAPASARGLRECHFNGDARKTELSQWGLFDIPKEVRLLHQNDVALNLGEP